MPKTRTARLTQGPVSKQLILLSLPMMWGFFMTLSTSLVDTFFVAQLGTVQLAAISFATPVTMVLIAVAFGTSHGAVATVSRALGRNHPRHAGQLATASLTLGVLISGLFTLVGIGLITPTFKMLGAADYLIPHIKDYISIWYLAYPPTVALIVINGLFRAIGESRISSRMMTMSAVANLILDPILIFGLFGMPRLELMGAAIASLLAHLISLAYGIMYLRREQLLADKFPTLKRMRALWAQVLTVALPSLGSSLLNQVIPLVVTVILATHGSYAVAAYGIVMRIEGILFIIYIGFSTALAPMAGQNWGAQKYDRIIAAGRTAAIISIAWGVLVATALSLGHESVLKLFNASPEVAMIAALYLVFVPFSYPGRALMNYYVSISNATGFAPRGLRMVIFYSVTYAACAYFGNAMYGIIGVFAAKFGVNIVVGVVSILSGKLTGSLRRHKPDPLPMPPTPL